MKRAGYYSGPGRTGSFTDTTPACRAYLMNYGEKVAFADLYEIVLLTLGSVTTSTGDVAGLVLRMAGTDYDVPFEGVVYAGGGANRGWRISREGIRTEIGTTVAELNIRLALDGTDFLPPADGNPSTPRFGLGEALASGIFDMAHVWQRRLILPDHRSYDPAGPQPPVGNRGDLGPGDTSLGAVTMFAGQLTEVTVDRSQAQLTVKSYLEKLAISMPRNHYQTTCLNTLYDKICAVSRTGAFGGFSFQFLGTIASSSANDTFVVNATQPTDYFKDGTIQFTSGQLCGYSQSIASWDLSTHTVVTIARLPRRPANGDGVCLQAGCNKVALYRDPATGFIDTVGTVDSPAHCAQRFNALPNFRGFPHVPPPDTAY